MKRKLLAATLLAGAVLLSALASSRLADLRLIPPNPATYFFAFGLSFVLAVLAGRLAPRAVEEEEKSGSVPPRVSRTRAIAAALAIAVAVVLSVWTWKRAVRPARDLTILLSWLGAIVAVVAAFPGGREEVRALRQRRSAGLQVAVVFVVALAGIWRLVGLDRSPAVFAGDEACQTIDGRNLIDGSWRENVFGTGWYSTMRLGMLPAGAGAAFLDSPIAGPRLPYAVAGTLSVAASAGAAGILGGGWAALAAASLLAFAPHHVHFSRLASVMILDSLLAALAVLLILAIRRSGSTRASALAGVVAGLALYTYSGGRMITLISLAVVPVVALRAGRTGRHRVLLLFAFACGLAVTAAPNLRFAVEHFDDWNARFNQAATISQMWLGDGADRVGLVRTVLAEQTVLGTLGLLSLEDQTTWFGGHPLIGPPLLTSLAICGLGWMLGRRIVLGAVLIGLLVAGNLAGVVLTTGVPSSQRASSLVPMMAIAGGTAVAGLLDLFPSRDRRNVPWRAAVGTLFVTAYLARTVTDLDTSYGGHHSAFAQSVGVHVRGLRRSGETVYFHGLPWLMARFEWVRYHLVGLPVVEVVPPADGSDGPMPPGLHVFPLEEIPRARSLQARLGIRRGIPLPYPGQPLRDSGYAFRVVENVAVLTSHPAPPSRRP